MVGAEGAAMTFSGLIQHMIDRACRALAAWISSGELFSFRV
jgi:hypothetical protein